jgi:hypothetical protein
VFAFAWVGNAPKLKIDGFGTGVRNFDPLAHIVVNGVGVWVDFADEQLG